MVAERLFDDGDGDLVLDGDVHAVVDHRQRRELGVFGDEQAGGRGVGRECEGGGECEKGAAHGDTSCPGER
jgi:hypothetical protein